MLAPAPPPSVFVWLIAGLLGGVVAGCGSEPAPPTAPDSSASDAPPAQGDEPDAVVLPAPDWSALEEYDDGPTGDETVADGANDDPAGVIVLPRDREPPLPSDERLAAFGLTRLGGQRLTVVADRPEQAAPLPGLIDAVWPAWVDYFGPPPARRSRGDDAPLMTAFLMAEPDLFDAADLVPDDLPPFPTGRQRGRRFWMYDVDEDYFRRSLAVHEATHVFMTLGDGRGNRGPLWYLEGMAELFGAHRVEADGSLTFRVIPGEDAAAGGWDRIKRVRADVAAGSSLTLWQIQRLSEDDFLDDRGYAWAWALCAFLDGHPAYTETFRTLAEPGRRGDFRAFTPDQRRRIEAEWLLFVTELVPAYDVAANAVQFEPEFRDGLFIHANRGWQNSGTVRKGQQVQVRAVAGEMTLADDPRPWESTADGISFDYHRGRRLGELQAAVLADAPAPPIGLADPIPVGVAGAFIAPRDGTLYLRINDRPDRRADNRGGVAVTIELD